MNPVKKRMDMDKASKIARSILGKWARGEKMETNPNAKLAVFPSKITGYTVGWLNEAGTWCWTWGNFKTREGAVEVLQREYPNNEIVHFNADNQPYHRHNKPKED